MGKGPSNRKILSGFVWTVAYNIISAIYGFISVPMLIDHYGKDQYGLIGLALSINVYMQLMDLGFNSTNVRFFSVWFSSRQYEKLCKAFQSSLSLYGIIGILNGLILFVVLIFSDHIFDITPAQGVILKKLLAVLIVSALINWYSSCFDQLIKATENVGWVQRRSILPKLIQIILLLFVVWWNISIVLYFALTSLAFITIIPLSIRKIKTEVSLISFKPSWNTAIIKEMLPYCLSIFSFSFFQFSFVNLRPVFLGIQGTLTSVADFRILNGIIGLVSIFGSMFLNILLPTTSKVISQGNRQAVNLVAYEGTRYISIIVSFCCFGVISVGGELLTLYVGEGYLYLIPWLNIWLLCTLANHNQAISSLILAGAKVKAIAINSAVASLCGLISAWFLIPVYQIGGIVYSYVIYLVIQLVFYYFYYWPRKLNIDSFRVFYYSFLPPVIIGILSCIMMSTIPKGQTSILDLLLRGIEFTGVYVIFSLLIIRKKDINFFSSVLKTKKK